MCMPHYIPLRNQAVDVLKELGNDPSDIAEGMGGFYFFATLIKIQ